MQLALLFRCRLVLPLESGQVTLSLRERYVKLRARRADPFSELREVRGHCGTARGALGSASALNEVTTASKKWMIIFRTFQNNAMTLIALQIILTASRADLISFHCP
jgi:hypothetical protein